MSFDLYLEPERDRSLDLNSIREYFETRPHFQYTNQARTQIWYANPLTGVHASFAVSDSQGKDASACASILANLNFVRPAFFAYEVMPVVEHLAATFNLMVYDPQTERSMPGMGSADALIESW
jgi:hypothetical protein